MKNALKLRISNALFVMIQQVVLNVNSKMTAIVQLFLNYVYVKNVKNWEILMKLIKNH